MAVNTLTVKSIPTGLSISSTVALISPSTRMNDAIPHRIIRATKFLLSIGYKVEVIYTRIPSNCTLKQSALHRTAEIHEAFSNPQISAIICTVGGYTCNELLEYLDYELIKAHPKIFCGYSDITLLHYVLYKHANLRTFYGPAALVQWAEFPSVFSFTTEHFIKAVTSTVPIGQFPVSEEWTDECLDWVQKADLTRARILQHNSGWRWIRQGKAKGMMFGGCLPCVLQLCGTKHDLPSYKEVILILELPEGDEFDKPTPLQMAQAQTCDLANRGVFEDIAGLVLGRSFKFNEEMTEQWENYVLELTDARKFPVLSRVDVGHTDPQLTIPFGVMAELDSEKNVWAALEPGVCYIRGCDDGAMIKA